MVYNWMEKQFYITNKPILNKEGRQFLIFILVCNVHCSLHFHSVRIDNVCEGYQVFHAIFSKFICMGTLHIFS
jgi:hypothetical protein